MLPGIVLSSLAMVIAVAALLTLRRIDCAFRFDRRAVAFAVLAFVSMSLLLKAIVMDVNAKGETVSGAAVYGDAGYHAIIINSFALTDNIPPQDPTFAGVPLGYHFLADFLAAIMVVLGMDFRVAMQLGAIVPATAALSFIYALAVRLLDSRKAGVFACLLVVFSGGLGFLDAYSDFSGSGIGLLEFLGSVHTDYSYFDHQGGLANMFETGFGAARATIAGLAPALAAVLLLLIAFMEDRRELLLPIGVAAGLLPMLQVHMFMALSVFVVVSVLAVKGLTWLRELALFSLITLALALPALAGPAAGYVSSGTPRINIGWAEDEAVPLTKSLGFDIGSYPVVPLLGYSLEEPDRIASFWLRNLGFFGLLLLAGLLPADRLGKGMFLGAFAVFLLANTIQFQPLEFDNIKLFYFFLTLSSLPAADALRRLWDAHTVGMLLAVILLLLSTATGVLALLFNLDTRYVNYGPEDYVVGEWVRKNTPAKAVFLTSDYAMHPVPNIAGRAVVEGYRGWLWTHALNITPRDEAVAAIYEAHSEDEVRRYLNEYGIDYVFIGPAERGSRQFKVNESFFDSSPLFEKVYDRAFDRGRVKIFRVRAS